MAGPIDKLIANAKLKDRKNLEVVSGVDRSTQCRINRGDDFRISQLRKIAKALNQPAWKVLKRLDTYSEQHTG